MQKLELCLLKPTIDWQLIMNFRIPTFIKSQENNLDKNKYMNNRKVPLVLALFTYMSKTNFD